MNILDDQAREIELRNSELQQKNLALEELNREKNEFLGIAAHDLKNPLASIILTVENLQRHANKISPEQLLRLQENIKTTAARMKAIVERLLDINAIESGNIPITLQSCNLSAMARHTVEEYRARATAKNITLHFASSEGDMFAIADEESLVAVLDNLISNAVKYSPLGKNVYVQVGRDGAMVRLDVQDEGPGFSAEDQLRLFGKYARLTPQPTGGEHSTGLGLSIVKRMVDAMRGHVWCSSKLGEGATFSLNLPAAEEGKVH
jgi:signal transduction histidine kinase